MILSRFKKINAACMVNVLIFQRHTNANVIKDIEMPAYLLKNQISKDQEYPLHKVEWVKPCDPNHIPARALRRYQ